MITFVFKNQRARYDNIEGYLVCNTYGEKVGVVWPHKHKEGELSRGQAEIRFYDSMILKYQKWQLVFINKRRISYYELSTRIRNEEEVILEIDDGKKSSTSSSQSSHTSSSPTQKYSDRERQKYSDIDTTAFETIGARIEYQGTKGTITELDFPIATLMLDNEDVKKIHVCIAIKNNHLTLA